MYCLALPHYSPPTNILPLPHASRPLPINKRLLIGCVSGLVCNQQLRLKGGGVAALMRVNYRYFYFLCKWICSGTSSSLSQVYVSFSHLICSSSELTTVSAGLFGRGCRLSASLMSINSDRTFLPPLYFSSVFPALVFRHLRTPTERTTTTTDCFSDSLKLP